MIETILMWIAGAIGMSGIVYVVWKTAYNRGYEKACDDNGGN